MMKSIHESPVVKKALEFAKEKHEGQKRRDGSPYIEHPKRVAEIVRKFKKSHDMETLFSAALLHDILEDTETDIVELSQNFGGLITLLVLELTSDSESIIKVGKKNYLAEKLKNPKKIDSWALTIKLSDRLDNVRDLVHVDKKFRERYVKETIKIIITLEKERVLSSTQKNLIKEIKKELRKYKK